ncbi:hypothetical protein BFL28_11800 [Sphingomonas turrisvirgatae]|uniref:Uncharacterized protein n=2 Tax=Sphingomonas turrisvirgatae TaxID=1888892 RepID=A0A1E3LZ27_9SPHN|nr:hypothetical protein BFL28_11800 [Sphingomonas turrisvirgatae]
MGVPVFRSRAEIAQFSGKHGGHGKMLPVAAMLLPFLPVSIGRDRSLDEKVGTAAPDTAWASPP